MDYFCPVAVNTVFFIDAQCFYKKIIAFTIFIQVQSNYTYFVKNVSILGQFLIVIHLKDVHSFFVVDQTLLDAMALEQTLCHLIVVVGYFDVSGVVTATFDHVGKRLLIDVYRFFSLMYLQIV